MNRILSFLLLLLLPLFSSASANDRVDGVNATYHHADSFKLSVEHASIDFLVPLEMPALIAEASERSGQEDEQKDQHNNEACPADSLNSSNYLSNCLSTSLSVASCRHAISAPLYALHHAWRHFLS